MSSVERPLLGTVTGQRSAPNGALRFIGTEALPMLDPYLLLAWFQPGFRGFEEHPHRGFETVTYMLSGRIVHADSKGNRGALEAGALQWMRAARGILHSELTDPAGGPISGFQIWVNLPAALKMSEPGYRDVPAAAIPQETLPGVMLRRLAGAGGAVDGSAVGAAMIDVALAPGATWTAEAPPDLHIGLLVFEGEVNGVAAERMAVFGPGDALTLRGGRQGGRALLLWGRPVNEPVAFGGPFVMNTREEVMQAYQDFQAGRF